MAITKSLIGPESLEREKLSLITKVVTNRATTKLVEMLKTSASEH